MAPTYELVLWLRWRGDVLVPVAATSTRCENGTNGAVELVSDISQENRFLKKSNKKRMSSKVQNCGIPVPSSEDKIVVDALECASMRATKLVW